MRPLLAGLLVLGLVGCASRGPEPFHADETFTLEERAELERGATFLYERLDKHDPDHEIPVRIVYDLPHDAPGAEGHIMKTPGVGGETTREHCIKLGTDTPFLPALIAHELGHYEGLGHVDVPHSVMNSIAELNWSAADQTECERVGMCATHAPTKARVPGSPAE